MRREDWNKGVKVCQKIKENFLVSRTLSPPLPPGVDMRISPYDKQDAILHQVKEWVREAGDGCSIEFSQSNPKIPFTSTETSDKWWSAFSTACEKK